MVSPEDISREIAERMHIPIGKSWETYLAINKVIQKVIKSGDKRNPDTFKSIYITKLGTFYPKLKQLKKYNELFGNL